MGAPQIASVGIFCPQSKAPGESYLAELHGFLCQNQYLRKLIPEVLSLRDTWTFLAKERDDIAGLSQGPKHMENLAEWITTGRSPEIASCMSGIVVLPLIVIIQVSQYFQYLQLYDLSHSQMADRLRAGGGIQGYCGGLCPALAIACSTDESEVIDNAVVAMRIALAIGAYGELGDDESEPGATTIVVRLKKVGQGEELVSRFPGSYISAVTDPKTISIVGSAPTLLKVKAFAREQGLLVNDMHIRGKVHNPENEDLAQELCQLCYQSALFHFPHANSLKVPVRSNTSGEIITKGSLAHEMVRIILASRCEWYTLLTKVAEDLDVSRSRGHVFATFGIGDCIPLSPFHKFKLQITKVDVQHLTSQNPSEDLKVYKYPPGTIAIVGASCRFPKANNLNEMWDLISSGTSTHREVPKDRFDLHGSYRAAQDRKFSDRRFFGNFIENVDSFDHAFFKTNPKEAAMMDPQQRMLLELAYQAVDSCGYLKDYRREGDNVGCFIGASFTEYLENTSAYAPSAYTSTGTIRAFLSGKISHFFGWSGPSEVIDTACSSSLVAINRACKAIQGGECKMALAGGINILTGVTNFLDLAKAGFLSSSGQCKPFDQAADGYCRSEGGGLVFLKHLKQAESDGDHILGLLPGTATNQGGLSASITIPHSPTQARLFRIILSQANMKADQVTYIETHGTGTQAGDPLEIASVREVFSGPSREHKLHIGSLKGNIGHAETAAGVASLLKVLAMIQNIKIPPQASYRTLNPKIPLLEKDNLVIDTKEGPWKAPILTASVNSYGAAGSNAAAICCEYLQASRERSDGPDPSLTCPIIISALSRESLDLNIVSLGAYLEKMDPLPRLGDIAFTLSEKRQRHRYIAITSASDTRSFAKNLKSGNIAKLAVPEKPKHVVLVFAGQSKKTVGMNATIYENYPQLRSYIEECDQILMGLGYSSFLPFMFQEESISSVVALQCGTFAMQYACAQSWLQAGLRVDAIIGHSFGELTGLVVSGRLSVRDGLQLIARRATLMETQWGPEKGAMLAIHGGSKTTQELLDSQPEIEIACYNAPTSHVVVGSAEAIDRIQDVTKFDQRYTGVKSQRLDVTHGFHSQFTTNILADLNECSNSLTYRTPDVPLETCTAEPNGMAYNYDPSEHARKPVYFCEAIQRIEKRLGPCIWLEGGMDSSIIPMTKRAVASTTDHDFQEMDSRRPLSLVCDITLNLWREGISVSDWKFTSKEHAFHPIWLPPYQFQPTKHWLANIDRAQGASPPIAVEPLPRPTLVRFKTGASKNDQANEFRICLGAERFNKIVSGHAVRQRPLCPASMYMECAAMGLQLFEGIGNRSLCFKNLSFETALGADPTRECFLSFARIPDAPGWSFIIRSVDEKSKSSTSARGEIALSSWPDLGVYERLILDRVEDLNSKPGAERLRSNRAYALFSRVVDYAEFFHAIADITLDKNEAVAQVNLPSIAEIDFDQSTTTQCCETVAIDGFIQVVGLLINSSTLVGNDNVYVATGIDNVLMSAACDFHQEKSWTVYAKYQNTKEGQAAGDIFVMTSKGSMAMVITGAHFKSLAIQKLEKLLDTANTKSSKRQGLSKAKSSPSDILGNGISPLHIPSPSGGMSPDISTADDEKSDADGADTSLSSELPSSGSEDQEKKSRDKKVLYTLLSEISGAPIESISVGQTLQDLGIDSLSAVELKDVLESQFDVQIEDDIFTLESTVQEILNFLGLETSFQESLEETPVQNDKDFSDDSRLTTKSIVSTNNYCIENFELGDPFGALEKSHEVFDGSAARVGFLKYWTEVAPEQEELMLAYICEAFNALGSNIYQTRPGQQVSMICYSPKHAKLMERLFKILEKHDLLTRQSSTLIRGGGRPPSKTSDQLHNQFVDKFPTFSGEARLMALTGSKLADCLTGKAEAVSLMFRNAATQKIMADYYCESPMLSTLTDQMVALIRDLVENVQTSSGTHPIRILEVGAGFGGTTRRLAAMLQESGRPVTYTFTDSSASLVMGAKSTLGNYSWMDFISLNLERDICSELGDTYDIIIGTNCVHATTDRAKTLSRLKGLLSEQGSIILSEVTEPIDWYDIVFALLESWWLASDGSTYPLQPPESWMTSFEQAGFDRARVAYSWGSTRESNTQRLLVASRKYKTNKLPPEMDNGTRSVQSTVYKSVDGIDVEADIYLPARQPTRAMPVALMIHGGGHMTLSRKAIRPFQTAYLLANNVLPISIDYRLCPEVSLIEGPMQDVCDAYRWVREGGLQAAVNSVSDFRLHVDGEKVVVLGWSTGGHLAMTTAWTSKEASLPPPAAILGFYSPTDFESGDLDVRRAEEYPSRSLPMDELIAALPSKPITNYSASPNVNENSHLGWLRPGDPRSELVLSFFKEGNAMPVLLSGLRPSASSPLPSFQAFRRLLAYVSPLAHVLDGSYTTPTCLIHGTMDEIAPFASAEEFVETAQKAGIKASLAVIEGARHIHDLRLKEGDDGWRKGVGIGYDFLFDELLK
ncbi:hypothetical protein ACLMJK_000005 [Lecanora helva]